MSVGLIEATPRSAASTPAQTSVGTSAGQILAANAGRKGLVIQNTGTTILYLVFGTSTPTTSVYHYALSACTANDDGKGGAWFDDPWQGAVQALSSGSGGQCVIAEYT